MMMTLAAPWLLVALLCWKLASEPVCSAIALCVCVCVCVFGMEGDV